MPSPQDLLEIFWTLVGISGVVIVTTLLLLCIGDWRLVIQHDGSRVGRNLLIVGRQGVRNESLRLVRVLGYTLIGIGAIFNLSFFGPVFVVSMIVMEISDVLDAVLDYVDRRRILS